MSAKQSRFRFVAHSRSLTTIYLVLVCLSIVDRVNVHGLQVNINERRNCSRTERTKGDIRSRLFDSDCSGRRRFLFTAFGLGGWYFPSQKSNAGEVGRRITQAVTTSDLGISVRTQIIEGARIVDKADGYWEGFSDRFGLGSKRKKEKDREIKVIPDLQALDASVAKKFLQISDQTFLSTTDGISSSTLQHQISKVADIVKGSYERSGVVIKEDLYDFQSGRQFDFACYVHYKAYSDLLLENKIDFRTFLFNFEAGVGKGIVEYFQLSVPIREKISSPRDRKRVLSEKLKGVEILCSAFVEKGFVALIERSDIPEEDFEDWSNDLCQLKFSIALDGDITQSSQILLQEQGFRLYPNFLRFALTYLLQQDGQQLSLIDYYFDTDYNSDPNKFEVKEVMINIVLESE